MKGFALDPRLENDSISVMVTGLCDLRLSRDARWPWLILVPRRADITEIFELTPLDQVLLAFETELVAKALKQITGATKINVGALGNIVRQLHVHVIARLRKAMPTGRVLSGASGELSPTRTGRETNS